MKTSQRHYSNAHDQKVLNNRLLFTARQYVNIDLRPLTASSAERLVTEPFNKLMLLRWVPLQYSKCCQSCQQSTETDYKVLYGSTELHCRHRQNTKRHAPDEKIVEWDDKPSTAERQSLANELYNAMQHYTVSNTELPLYERDIFTYIVPWYGYIPSEHGVEPPEHISKHFISFK